MKTLDREDTPHNSLNWWPMYLTLGSMIKPDILEPKEQLD